MSFEEGRISKQKTLRALPKNKNFVLCFFFVFLKRKQTRQLRYDDNNNNKNFNFNFSTTTTTSKNREFLTPNNSCREGKVSLSLLFPPREACVCFIFSTECLCFSLSPSLLLFYYVWLFEKVDLRHVTNQLFITPFGLSLPPLSLSSLAHSFFFLLFLFSFSFFVPHLLSLHTFIPSAKRVREEKKSSMSILLILQNSCPLFFSKA